MTKSSLSPSSDIASLISGGSYPLIRKSKGRCWDQGVQGHKEKAGVTEPIQSLLRVGQTALQDPWES